MTEHATNRIANSRSLFKAQLEEDSDPRRHQRDKYDILVPVIDVKRLPENLQAQVKAREDGRKRDGPTAVGKVVTLIDALVADYDNFNETFKDVSTKPPEFERLLREADGE